MRFKTLTTIFFVLGVLTTLSIPFVVRTRPGAEAEREELVRYGTTFTAVTATAIVFFLISILCAAFMVRQVAKEVREENQDNFRELIENSLRDHLKKDDDTG